MHHSAHRGNRVVWWHASAAASVGLRAGELALSLPRHFSARDLLKWAARLV